LRYCLEQIKKYLSIRHLKLNKKKTQISKITQPIHFLGFSFRLINTGKVLMRVLPEKVTHERRRLKKLVKRCKSGYMTRRDVDECFKSWVAHASKGDCYKLIQSMTEFYNKLWEECKNV